MEVTFLGTGTSQGVPVIACSCEVCQSLDYRDKRLRSSVHIAVEGKSLVVDTSPDFRQQMLQNRIQKLDAVLFTHQHKDHTAGLDDVRAYNFKYKTDMPLYACESVIKQLKQEFEYAFAEKKYPGVPNLEVHLIENQAFDLQGIRILPILVMHYQLPVFGFRIHDFTYITDAKTISKEEIEKIKGSKIVVLNALRIEPHISHFNLEEALAVANEIGAEKTYLTHISHNLGKHREVEKILPNNVFLAYDGLKISL